MLNDREYFNWPSGILFFKKIFIKILFLLKSFIFHVINYARFC